MLEDRIPMDTQEQLNAYASKRQPVGGFLFAVLANDLEQACGRADRFNAPCLIDIVSYAFSRLPWACRGSPEKVRAWLGQKQVDKPDEEGE